MTATHRLLLATAAALPLALGACDNKCPTTNPKIATGGVPACTGVAAIQAGAAVTVKLNVCPRCDQTNDVCTVTLPNTQDPVHIQLDPLVQVCDANPTCPIGGSCSVVNCTFTAPAAGSYTLLVNDPDTGLIEQPIDVVAAGQTTCTP